MWLTPWNLSLHDTLRWVLDYWLYSVDLANKHRLASLPHNKQPKTWTQQVWKLDQAGRPLPTECDHNNQQRRTESQENGNTVGSFTLRAHWSNRNTTTCSVRSEDEKLTALAQDLRDSAPAVAQTARFG